RDLPAAAALLRRGHPRPPRGRPLHREHDPLAPPRQRLRPALPRPPGPALQRLRRPFTRADMLPDPGEEWFIDLERMCGGNLRQALDYWLLSARLDPKTE